MCEAGCRPNWVMLHWISLLAFLLICGPDIPVCSTYHAWRFSCVYPLLLEACPRTAQPPACMSQVWGIPPQVLGAAAARQMLSRMLVSLTASI